VEDVDAKYARLLGEGVRITTPIETEDRGERFFQVTDPRGVVFQLVTWIRPTTEPEAQGGRDVARSRSCRI